MDFVSRVALLYIKVHVSIKAILLAYHVIIPDWHRIAIRSFDNLQYNAILPSAPIVAGMCSTSEGTNNNLHIMMALMIVYHGIHHVVLVHNITYCK